MTHCLLQCQGATARYNIKTTLLIPREALDVYGALQFFIRLILLEELFSIALLPI